MAFIPRTWQAIQTQILQQKAAQPALSGLTSQSKAAYWILWAFIFSVAQMLLEQAWAILVGEIETDVANAVPGTPLWIQAQVLKFQVGDVIQINSDFTISYPVVNTNNQIVTSAAVVVTPSGAINIKAAKGGISPAPLSSPELIELKAYLQSVLPAGPPPNVISVAADTLQVNAIVYYNGQYNSVIQANVIAALNSYMSLVPFNGLVRISDIEKAILAVAGVVDVSFATTGQITVTPDAGSPTDLILVGDILTRSAQTYSGYLVNAAGPNDFATTITFSVAQQ